MADIYVLGGSYNPPGDHHVVIARRMTRLKERNDRVIIRPCGKRQDKPSTHLISSFHRAVLCALAFGNLPDVELDLSDLVNDTFTPTFDLDERLRQQYPNDHIWHMVGSDLTDNGPDGMNEIERSWYRGAELRRNASFLMIPRVNSNNPMLQQISPTRRIATIGTIGASTQIRERIEAGDMITDLVPRAVAKYIHQFGLYLPQKEN